MKELHHVNLWDFWRQGHWVAVMTNGSVGVDNCAIMGLGTALQAYRMFPGIERELGIRIANKIRNNKSRINILTTWTCDTGWNYIPGEPGEYYSDCQLTGYICVNGVNVDIYRIEE